MDPISMPWSVGIRFTHASLQALAEANGLDLLHIKGPAVDDSLLQVGSGDPSAGDEGVGPVPRRSIDADVLVRPSHVDRLFDVMHRHDWTTAYRFEDGSAFEHAATLVHPFLAPVDVHRRFPGLDLDPDIVFDRLWASRHAASIAGRPCAVPSVTAQRLILIVHAVRGGAVDHPDINRCWVQATDDERLAVQHLADELGASVALAAGTGRLDDFVGVRGFELWRALSTGEHSLPKLWLARVKAAPTRRAAVRTAVRLLLPNPRRMETLLGRKPTVREVSHAYVARVRNGAREVRHLLTGVLPSARGRR